MEAHMYETHVRDICMGWTYSFIIVPCKIITKGLIKDLILLIIRRPIIQYHVTG